MATVRSRSESDEGRPGDVVGHIGPAPIEPGPRRAPAPHIHRAWAQGPSPMDEDDDAYDALTDLFLGEIGVGRLAAGAAPVGTPVLRPAEAPRAGDREPDAALSGIEFLILGNLPVLSSAWAAQYARTVSEAERSPVAFVQVRGGTVTVEVVDAGGGMPLDPGGDGPGGQELASAIGLAAGMTGRWIVRADETDEPSLAHRPSVRWLTLLTSADEAAVAGAYRAIKHLGAGGDDGGESEPEATAGNGIEGPSIRLAVMGAEEESADAAYTKIAAAARTFLSRPLGRAPGVSKIRSSRPPRRLFSGRVAGGAEHVAGLIEAALAAPARAAEVPATPAAAVESTSRRTAGPDVAGGLAMHVPGLIPVDFRCPYAGEVELAIGPEGRLHLLARRSEHPAGEAGMTGVEPLMVAGAWAEAHAGLIGRCLGAGVPAQGSIAAPATPVSHLFVSEPKPVRGLLDTSIRVHLLASVIVGGSTGWVCRELN